ncbi:MAG TPA: hypothetical protein VLY85_02140 [Thermoplasmata archaeon]|nr:hypothetical protein [Thermoplasmata archaeon]
MNRTIGYVGVAMIVEALGLWALPVALSGHEELGPALIAGVFILGAGFAVILWAAASPNPALSTVGGVFGNWDEDHVSRLLGHRNPTGPARYRPGPLETTNCEWCYTAIPARQLLCPRCAKPRRCRRCHKPLYYLAGAVRCAPCVKDEVFCDCPRSVRRPYVRVMAYR